MEQTINRLAARTQLTRADLLPLTERQLLQLLDDIKPDN